MAEIKPKPMKQEKEFDIPRLTPKHDDLVDAHRYFRAPYNPKKPLALKYRILIATVGALTVLWILQGIVMALNGFFGNYDVQTHPILQMRLNWPFTIEKRVKPTPAPAVKGASIETSPTPIPKPAASQATPQPDRIAYFIWSRETGKGLAPSGWHINCRNKGKWNEIGYGGPDFCFDSKEQGFTTLTRELTARIAKNGLKETLCVYNLGYNKDSAGNRVPFDDCSYYQDFLKTL